MPSKKDNTKRGKNEPFYKAFVNKDTVSGAQKRRTEPSRDGVKRSAKSYDDEEPIAKKSRKPVNDDFFESKDSTKRAPRKNVAERDFNRDEAPKRRNVTLEKVTTDDINQEDSTKPKRERNHKFGNERASKSQSERSEREYPKTNNTERSTRFNDERREDERPKRRDDFPMKSQRMAFDNNDRRGRDEMQPRNPKLPKPVQAKHIKPLYDESMWGEDGTMRLNKYVANAGIASRRAADDLIAAGHVTVNGEVIKEMGHRVKKTDNVMFKGKTIAPIREYSYILLNKPKNCITTADDERGRLTVLDLVADATTERLYPVGRLDRNTTGLLILTNDGDLAKRLMHPSHKIKKVYYATLDKGLKRTDLEKIRAGLKLEDGVAEVDDVDWVDSLEDSNEVGIQIHIGKNRIVRRIFEHLGYNVERLDRVLIGSLTKKDLPRGKWRHLTPNEIRLLKHF